MKKTGTILGSWNAQEDGRAKQRIAGGKWEKEKKRRRRMDSKKETIKYEGEREREWVPFLPSMPLLDHVKYANCGYAEALLALVLPSTNYISFGRMCVARATMGTHRIPRVYAPCPKTVHTVKYTRAPTFLSRSWTSSFPPSTHPPFVALVAILPQLMRDARPFSVYLSTPRNGQKFLFSLLFSLSFSLPIRELSNRSGIIGPRCPENPSRPISPIHRAGMRVPHSTRHSFRCSKISSLPVDG